MEWLTNKREADAQREEYERRLANGYPRNIPEERFLRLADLESLCNYTRLRELAEADKDGRMVVLPCKDWLDVVFGDQVLFWGIDKDCMENPIREISVDDAERIAWYGGYKSVYLVGMDENGDTWEFYPQEIGKTVFLTREEAEKTLETMRKEKTEHA